MANSGGIPSHMIPPGSGHHGLHPGLPQPHFPPLSTGSSKGSHSTGSQYGGGKFIIFLFFLLKSLIDKMEIYVYEIFKQLLTAIHLYFSWGSYHKDSFNHSFIMDDTHTDFTLLLLT